MQGAAQGVWNEMTARVVGGSEEMWVWKVESSGISVMVDMVVGVMLCRDRLEVEKLKVERWKSRELYKANSAD